MAKRRAKKEGTIYKRSNGTWRAQITLNGRRQSLTGLTQAECVQWLREIHGRKQSASMHQKANLHFGEYLNDWLVTAKANLRPNTMRQYSQIVFRYISPTLGKIKLEDLQPHQIQQLYTKLLENGIGRRTVQVVHAVIHRSLNQAVKLQILGSNPSAAVSPPNRKEKELEILDENQVHDLLVAAKAKGFRHYAFYLVAVVTGLRQGELLGLKWEDFDPDRGTLRIVRQVRRVQGGGFEFALPKTKRGSRTVKLGKETVRVLRQHFINQLEQKTNAGDQWQENELIFPSVVGTPQNPPNLVRAFRALLKKAGLPRVRFHSLRHTAASLMLNNGVDVLVVSRRLGHAKPSTTLDVYGHLIPSSQETVAELMDDLVTPVAVELHPIAPELHQEAVPTRVKQPNKVKNIEI